MTTPPTDQNKKHDSEAQIEAGAIAWEEKQADRHKQLDRDGESWRFNKEEWARIASQPFDRALWEERKKTTQEWRQKWREKQMHRQPATAIASTVNKTLATGITRLTLSDHTADKIAAATTNREEEYRAANEAYHQTLDARKRHQQELRKAVSMAWAERKFWSAFSWCVTLGLAWLSPKPSPPMRRRAGREEIVWASGNQGERRVSEFLSSQLSGDWVLISGYKNSKGEIDQILLGPRGIFAIEIKFLNGVIHCDGDLWQRDKYDKYGNLEFIRK